MVLGVIVSVAFLTAPWGLLLLLVLIPLLSEGKDRQDESPRSSAKLNSAASTSAETTSRSVKLQGHESFGQPGAGPEMPALGALAGSQSRKTLREAHFTRHANTPGWLYAARQEFRPDDFFKVGYTTRNPRERVRQLNDQAKAVTAAVGRFSVVYSRQVARSQSAEARVFEKLAAYRVSTHREFFQAPLELIVQAIEAAASMEIEHQDVEKQAVQPPSPMWSSCPACGRAIQFMAPRYLGEIEMSCSPCGAVWSESPEDRTPRNGKLP